MIISYKERDKRKLAKGTFTSFKKFFSDAVEKYPDHDWEREFKSIGGKLPVKKKEKKDNDS